MNNRSEEKINELYFYINKDIYNIKAIMKAAYNFIDDYYILLDYCKGGKIKVTLQCKSSCDRESMEKCKGEFFNELLRQNIRYIVSKETKNIRELLMGKALYDTCIEYENPIPEEINNQSSIISDDLGIFTNWFDKNEE